MDNPNHLSVCWVYIFSSSNKELNQFKWDVYINEFKLKKKIVSCIRKDQYKIPSLGGNALGNSSDPPQEAISKPGIDIRFIKSEEDLMDRALFKIFDILFYELKKPLDENLIQTGKRTDIILAL